MKCKLGVGTTSFSLWKMFFLLNNCQSPFFFNCANHFVKTLSFLSFFFLYPYSFALILNSIFPHIFCSYGGDFWYFYFTNHDLIQFSFYKNTNRSKKQWLNVSQTNKQTEYQNNIFWNKLSLGWSLLVETQCMQEMMWKYVYSEMPIMFFIVWTITGQD